MTVDPAHQDAGTGRHLMEALLDRTRDAAGVRLVQTAYHARSLALYAKLGFTSGKGSVKTLYYELELR